MGTALVLLEIAKKDLKASKVLYQNQLYPQSIFLLQQSYEKTIKSFFLQSGTIIENELKNYIRHDPFKLWNKLILKHEECIGNIENAVKIFPSLKNVETIKFIGVSKQRRQINQSKNHLSKKMDIEEYISLPIDYFLELIEVIESSKKEAGEISKELKNLEDSSFEMGFTKSKEELLNFLEAMRMPDSKKIEGNYDPSVIDKVKDEIDNYYNLKEMIPILRKFLEFQIKVYYLSISLLSMAEIFRPLANSPRYPENNLNPLEIYGEGFPLVQIYSKLAQILEELIDNIELLFEEIGVKG